MFAQLVLATVLLFAGKDPAVVGTWGMGGATLFWINADGTGEMEGEAFTWSTDKGVMTLVADGETEKVGYSVKNGKLVVAMDGTPITLDKMGGRSAAPAAPVEPAPAGKPAKAAGKPTKAGNDPLSQLLLRNAWCSFSFNKSSGVTKKSRVQFFADGTVVEGAQGEGYSSGYGGTMASQENSGMRGNWRVVGGKLEMSQEGANQWVEQPTSVTRNSNGSPIVMSGGKEYMVCE